MSTAHLHFPTADTQDKDLLGLGLACEAESLIASLLDPLA